MESATKGFASPTVEPEIPHALPTSGCRGPVMVIAGLGIRADANLTDPLIGEMDQADCGRCGRFPVRRRSGEEPLVEGHSWEVPVVNGQEPQDRDPLGGRTWPVLIEQNTKT
jgi:hypothetical protein